MPRSSSKPRSPSPAKGQGKGQLKTKAAAKDKPAARVAQAKASTGAKAKVVQAVPSLTEVAAAPARAGSRHAIRRPRARADDDLDGPETGDRQFVTALARGLDVLAAFRRGEGRLGNQELAERTGLPKPTISRITHTLTQLGYLNYNQRLSQYELGGATLSLGYAALSNLDVRRIARPFMQELANATNLTVALALRDKLMMLNIETCEGQALVGLRLSPGSRMPIANTAMGRAYLAVVSESERAGIFETLRGQFGDEWPSMRRSIERSIKDIEEQGFCVSIGGQKDINGAAAAIPIPDGRGFYALSIGGPAYLASPEYVTAEVGPMVADAAQRIIALLGGDMPARSPRK
ncbi:MAG: IclR family transcriptional regulator [Rhizobiales bacterium]|nr:IclR family transcriptional regulator [Hyphomicrobiales bacterium]